MSLSIRVMHVRVGALEELKGKHSNKTSGGEGTIPIFLSKPVPPSLLGEYDKPSLSAWPSPMVPLGQTVTLQCHFHSPLKRFRLFKTDGTSLPKLHGNHFNTFTLGPVTREHAGSYTCSGLSRSLPVFSRSSDPLQIVVTGRRGPAQPGTAIYAGNHILGPSSLCGPRFTQDFQPGMNQERETTLRV